MSRSGGDDYQPHPGDPWHPDWSPDGEETAGPEATDAPDEATDADAPVEEGAAAPSEDAPDEEPRRRRFGLFRRRSQDEDVDDAVGEPPVEPPPVADVADQPAESEEPDPAPVSGADRLDAAEDEEAIWASVLAGADGDEVEDEGADLGVEDPEVAYQALQELEEDEDDELDQWVAFLDGPEEQAEAEPDASPDDTPETVEVEAGAPEEDPEGPARRWWPFGRGSDESAADEPTRDEPMPGSGESISDGSEMPEPSGEEAPEMLPTGPPVGSDIAAALGELAGSGAEASEGDPGEIELTEEPPAPTVPEVTSEEPYDETHEADLVADLLMDVSAADLGSGAEEPEVEAPAAEYEDVELGSGELSSLVEPSEEEVPVGSVSEGESEDDLAAAVAALGADEEPEVVSEEPVEPEVRPGPGAVDDLPTQLTIDGTVTDEDVPPAHDEIDEVAVPDAGDPGRLPSSWFAEIDEDEVEPPPHTVPEDDYEAEAPPEPAEVAAVAAVDAVMEDALDTASDLDVVEASAEIDDGAVRPEESAVVEEPPVIEEPPVVEEAEEAGLADDAATVEPVVVDEPVAADEPAVDEPVIPGAEEDTFSLPDFGEFRFEDDAPVAEASGPDDDETPPAEAADDLTDGDVVWRASDGEPDEPGLWAPAGPPRVPLGHDDDEPTAEIWPPDLGYEHPGAPEQDPEFVPEPDESLDAEAAMAAAFDELDRAAAEAQEFELAAPGPAESDEAEVPEGDADDREPDEWDAGRPDAGGPWDGSTEDAPIDVYDHEEADLSEGLYSGGGTVEHRGLAEAVEAASRETTERTALSAPMAGIETGVVGFEDVEDLGTGEEYEEPDPSDLGVRVATGVTLIALVVAAIWAGGEWLAVLLGGFVMLALYEFYRTLRSMGYHPVTVFGYLGGIATYALTWFHGPIAIPASIVATAVVVYFVYTFTPQRTDALTNGGLTVLGVAWIAGTAAFALPIVATADFRVLVFGVVVATVAMDVGAYFFGRSFGNARLAPVLSPNKSIEGLAGGVMLCLGATIGWGWLDLSDPMTIRTGAWLGLVVALAAPLGDLAESMVKRSLGVKDMGSILPGHGGILDRIDAFLFAIPPAWILFEASGLLV